MCRSRTRPPAPTIATSDCFSTTVTANGRFVLTASGQIAMAANKAQLTPRGSAIDSAGLGHAPPGQQRSLSSASGRHRACWAHDPPGARADTAASHPQPAGDFVEDGPVGRREHAGSIREKRWTERPTRLRFIRVGLAQELGLSCTHRHLVETGPGPRRDRRRTMLSESATSAGRDTPSRLSARTLCRRWWTSMRLRTAST